MATIGEQFTIKKHSENDGRAKNWRTAQNWQTARKRRAAEIVKQLNTQKKSPIQKNNSKFTKSSTRNKPRIEKQTKSNCNEGIRRLAHETEISVNRRGSAIQNRRPVEDIAHNQV